MEDRFKFRAWYTPIYSCEDDEKPHYVYDIEQIYDGFINKGHSELGWVSSFGSLLDGDEYIIEQCTGLKDKNGKLIYEGDLIKEPANKYPLEIYYDKGAWQTREYRKNGNNEQLLYVLINCYGVEIIGNIHENADLLGEE